LTRVPLRITLSSRLSLMIVPKDAAGSFGTFFSENMRSKPSPSLKKTAIGSFTANRLSYVSK